LFDEHSNSFGGEATLWLVFRTIPDESFSDYVVGVGLKSKCHFILKLDLFICFILEVTGFFNGFVITLSASVAKLKSIDRNDNETYENID
jgi:hypothetical protein